MGTDDQRKLQSEKEGGLGMEDSHGMKGRTRALE